MDLGIRGRHAIVCGSSKGLGRGCAEALAAEGVHVTLVARNAESLDAAMNDIRRHVAAPDATVTAVACDITTPDGRARVLAACPQPDIIVTNAGGPAPGDFRNWSRDDWIAALDANMLTPIELMRLTVDGMIARRFGRIVNITSAAAKAAVEHMGLSNGARAGLTGFVAGLARTTVRHNVTINNLLPGPFDTGRLQTTMSAPAKAAGKSVEEMMDARRQQNPARRFGTVAEFGATCAFLCSAHAGYMTGQNIVLDGGAYPGTF